MSTTVTAIFDGQTLKFDAPLDLEANTRYVVTIEPQPDKTGTGDAWDVLEQMIGTVDAPADWSLEHDHYIHGTPKRYGKRDE